MTVVLSDAYARLASEAEAKQPILLPASEWVFADDICAVTSGLKETCTNKTINDSRIPQVLMGAVFGTVLGTFKVLQSGVTRNWWGLGRPSHISYNVCAKLRDNSTYWRECGGIPA